jgi:hypothetical protein
MKDLDVLIRLAKASLERPPIDPASTPKWQQTMELVAFAAKVKSKLDPDTLDGHLSKKECVVEGRPGAAVLG